MASLVYGGPWHEVVQDVLLVGLFLWLRFHSAQKRDH